MAIIGVGVAAVGVGSGVAGANQGAASQRDAQNASERALGATNQANLIADLIARGAPIPTSIGSGRTRVNFPAALVGQSSSVLPYYFGGTEAGLANSATDLFNASFGLDSTHTLVPTSNLARYANSTTGAANAARDRALLSQLTAQLGNGTGPNAKSIRERIGILENRLRGATAPENRSGVNPGVGGAISQMMADYQAQVDKYKPEFDAGDELISKTFNGGVTDEMLAEAKPVQDARIKLANMEKDAGIEALQEKLNEIKAIQGGDSLRKQRLEFDARRKIGTDAARGIGGAELANAQEEQRIRGSGRDLMFRSLDLPYNRAQQSINLSNLPATSAQQRFSAALSPFQFFRTGPGNFNIAAPSDRSSIPGSGQILATAGARAGDVASRYLLDEAARRRANPTPPPGTPSYDIAANGNYMAPGTFDYSADYGFGPGAF